MAIHAWNPMLRFQLRLAAAMCIIEGLSHAQDDPFKDVAPATAQPATAPPESWVRRFFKDNFGFRKEIMSEFDINENGDGASRQSVGFEVLKKFSTSTSTVASFDFQGRLVRRDGYNTVLNDMEGAGR